MSYERNIKQSKKRRVLRVRSKMKTHMPRVTVFRSLKQIYAQIINDTEARTVVSCSSLELKKNAKVDKKSMAHAVGKELAARAIKQGISKVSFDRGPYLFHGRIKALAEGMQEGGITI